MFSNNSKHSTVVGGVRLLDVPEEDAMKNSAWRIFCVVEGPDEFPTWRFVFREIVREFQAADPTRGTCGCVFDDLT